MNKSRFSFIIRGVNGIWNSPPTTIGTVFRVAKQFIGMLAAIGEITPEVAEMNTEKCKAHVAEIRERIKYEKATALLKESEQKAIEERDDKSFGRKYRNGKWIYIPKTKKHTKWDLPDYFTCTERNNYRSCVWQRRHYGKTIPTPEEWYEKYVSRKKSTEVQDA